VLYAVDTRSNSTLADSKWLSLEETLHEEGDVAERLQDFL